MNRKLAFSVLTGVLTASLFAGTGLSALAQKSSQTYAIVFKKNLPSNYEEIISKAGGNVLRTLPKIGGLEVESSDPGFLKNLKGVSGIQAANIEMKQKLDFKKVDPSTTDGQPVTDIPQADEIYSYWDYQWDIKRITHNGDSYNIETGGTEKNGQVKHKAIVGVIDTGIDPDHPDLKANIVGGENFVPAGADAGETGDPNDIMDRVGHGTHVAGSIAANGKVKGVGPDLGIRVYRVFPESGSAPNSWITDAIIQAADDNVDVINMSIGDFDAISRYNFQGTGSYSDIADILLWKRAIKYAIGKNVTVVVAAGNESLNLNNPTEITDYMNQEYGYLGFKYKGATMEVPGQIPGVITVSSSNEWSTDKIAFYSNYGTKSIDVTGPGGDNGPVYDETRDLSQRDFHYRTLSTWPTYLDPYFTSNLKGYALLNGTSMASPKVAGIAGVIKAANPDLKPSQVAALIRKTSVDMGKRGTDQLFGAGEANAYNALK
ncbi:S8 family peptidase [Brevibacillus choshinensis]|uniref:S8 family peptidase n=1 Tax=Brevibacillus choshinensis TaxID=54911 RepID=UPI002E1FC12B|nr:S8 family serine peptidase [Brevibacillus choshinensis]MED4750809.1 S8 family serine peptidase [Brevibacillus choshinensis]